MLTAELVQGILKEVGVDPERFSIEWASAAEGTRYVELITAFTKKIKELGPVGHAEQKDAEDLLLKLRAARSATEVIKLRTGLGNLTKQFRKDGSYSPEVVKEKVTEKLGKTVRTEIGAQEILLRLKEQGPLSLKDLAGKVSLSAEEITDFLAKLGKKGKASESEGRWRLSGPGEEVV
jgi:predicted Rossmann fold nucleotide-binding protein DprA/Smf involved in DNA uptake